MTQDKKQDKQKDNQEEEKIPTLQDLLNDPEFIKEALNILTQK